MKIVLFQMVVFIKFLLRTYNYGKYHLNKQSFSRALIGQVTMRNICFRINALVKKSCIFYSNSCIYLNGGE